MMAIKSNDTYSKILDVLKSNPKMQQYKDAPLIIQATDIVDTPVELEARKTLRSDPIDSANELEEENNNRPGL